MECFVLTTRKHLPSLSLSLENSNCLLQNASNLIVIFPNIQPSLRV